MHDKDENILTSPDKSNGFYGKLIFGYRISHVEKKQL